MPIVTSPTAGDVHVNRPLTNFGQKYLQDADKFIALRAMPNLPVGMQSDLYWTFNRGDFNRDEAQERADGTESAGGGFQVSTSPYFAKVYAFHKDVTDRQRANQDPVINLEQSATQFVANKMLIKRERLFQQRFFNTGIWSSNVNVDWTSGASTPIVDVRTGLRTVHLATGFRPNRMIFGRQAWDTLLNNDDLLSRITGGATTSQPAIVQRQLVAALFEIDEIFVMDAIYNTADEGGSPAESNAFIGGDLALLYYAPKTVNAEEPTAGVQFSWTGYTGATGSGFRMKNIRAELLSADRIEGEMAFDYKVVAPDLGYMFTTPSAP